MNWFLILFGVYTLHLNAKGLVTDSNAIAVVAAVGLIVCYDWFWKSTVKGTLIPELLAEIYAGRDWPPSWLQQKADMLAHLDARKGNTHGIFPRYVLRKTAAVVRDIQRL